MTSLIEVLDFYEDQYRPARHPGDPESRTCEEYRSCIRNLSRPRQFQQWLAMHADCKSVNSESYREFQKDLQRRLRIWKKSQPSDSKIALNRQFDRELSFGGEPAWWATLADLSDTLVVGAMNFLVEMGKERTTANKVRQHVNSVWMLAKRKKLVTTRPENEKYRVKLDEPVAMFPEDIDRLLVACAAKEGFVGDVPAAQWWSGFYLFMLDTGLRIGAALSMPTAKLLLDRGQVNVPAELQKQRKEQTLDLFPSTVEILSSWRLSARGVATIFGDWPFNSNTLRRHHKRNLVDAGIYASVDEVPHDMGFHCLRKTLASTIYAKHGIDVACARLGHSHTSVTWRYIGKGYKHEPKVRELIEPFAKPTIPIDQPPPEPPDLPGQLRLFTGEAG